MSCSTATCWASVRRISPEAPIPVLRAGRARAVLGGAANVAQNVAALGGRAMLVGVVGDDEAGEEVGHALIARRGSVARQPRRRHRAADHGQDPLHVRPAPVAAPGSRRPPSRSRRPWSPSCWRASPRRCARRRRGAVGLRQGRAVRRGAGSGDRNGAAAGKKVIADPKRTDFAAYRGAERADAQRDRGRRARPASRRATTPPPKRPGGARSRHRRRTRCW